MTDPPAVTPEAVFRDFAPRIYHTARRLLASDSDAEDVASDVLLQVVRKLDTFRGDAGLGTWLHRVTVNAALAYRAKKAGRARHETAVEDEALADLSATHDPWKFPRAWAVPPDAAALAKERRAVIDAAIAMLPEMYRDVFVLTDVDGLANADAAELLGLTVAAVKSRLHRARLRMRDALAPHFEEEFR